MKRKALLSLLIATSIFFAGCQNTSTKPEESANSDSATTTENAIEESSTQPEEKADAESSDAETPAQEDTSSAAAITVDADSWSVIQNYGFENEHSTLSYSLESSTLQEYDSYYTIDAVFSKPAVVPANLNDGDSYTLTTNELTGEQVTVVYNAEEKNLLDEESGQIYYYDPSAAVNGNVTLYCDSDDRVDVAFYEGKLSISKNAVTGAEILQKPYEQITKDNLMNNPWFNAISFDDHGIVSQLVFIGD